MKAKLVLYIHYQTFLDKGKHIDDLPLSVQRLGGGQTSCRPLCFTTWWSRARTYLFDATPPDTTYKGKNNAGFNKSQCGSHIIRSFKYSISAGFRVNGMHIPNI